MRNGFSMLMALAVIVIVATVSMLVLSLSGKMTEATASQYRQEQAALLAKSYHELALFKLINQDINTSCLTSFSATVNNLIPNGTAGSLSGEGQYYVDVNISYIGDNLTCPGHQLNAAALATDYNDSILPPPATKSVAAALIDVTVRYQNTGIIPDHNVSYHIRRLNKI